MSVISKVGLSIAALGPKITLLGALIGFLAGGSAFNIVGATAGAVTGSIIGGAIGGVCVLIGGALIAYDMYLEYQENIELEKNNNINSPSTTLINHVTNENRVEIRPVVSNDNRIEVQPITYVSQQQEPSWYENIASFFSYESKPTLATYNNNLEYRK